MWSSCCSGLVFEPVLPDWLGLAQRQVQRPAVWPVQLPSVVDDD